MVDIDGAHVFPQDTGTDAPSDYDQPDSAGFFGGMIRRDASLDTVETGLEFNPDYGLNETDITAGLAFLLVDQAVQVQNENGEYAETWNSGIGIVVDVPAVQGVPLSAGAENHVFLAVDMSAVDGASIEVNTTDEQPPEPYVKLGRIDTDAEETFLENRGGISEFDIEAHIGSEDNPHAVSSDQVGAPSDAEFSALESDLSDHEANGDHVELTGDVVNRSAPITRLEGSTYHLHVDDSLPSGLEPGDEIIWYE